LNRIKDFGKYQSEDEQIQKGVKETPDKTKQGVLVFQLQIFVNQKKKQIGIF
jgi:hypothetical protein